MRAFCTVNLFHLRLIDLISFKKVTAMTFGKTLQLFLKTTMCGGTFLSTPAPLKARFWTCDSAAAHSPSRLGECQHSPVNVQIKHFKVFCLDIHQVDW